MISKRTKKLFGTLALAGIIIGQMSSVSAFADENTQSVIEARVEVGSPAGTANLGGGSAQITISGNSGQTLVGKKFNVYKLFDAENSVGLESINYTLNPTYKTPLQNVVGKKLNKTATQVTEYEIIDYINSLNTNKVEGAQADQTLEGRYSDFRYFVEELRDEIKKLNIKGDVVNVSEVRPDNSVIIAGLDYGYYVVDEVTAVDGTYSASSLCMVNTANPTAEVQIKSDYPSVIKKIQEDDNNTGWNDIGDYEIGQTVPYKFESNVPNMNGYHKYYYAWHDRMDEALTFKKDTVSIVIEGKNKSYTLNPGEFNIVENPGNGETFKVEITDLKAIVDREFNNKNSLGENEYGQKVILRYDATLNDKAANDTGRPGFENDVKLEFSNNPDGDSQGETGETPWDTVVCFTFKIEGLKVNDHNLNLEGAKFRLYSDKDLKNEVYVKKSTDGYIVINRDSLGGTDHIGGTTPKDAVEMVSNADGVFNIIGLDQGTYYLKETDAPDGYRPLLDPIEINVVPTYTTDRDNYIKGDGATDKTLKTLEATAKIKSFYSGIFNTEDLNLTTDINEGSMNLTVVNKVGTKLPITGSSMTLLMVSLGTGTMIYSMKRKK